MNEDSEPPDLGAAFQGDDEHSAEATAAAVLALGWRLSGRPGLEDCLAGEELDYLAPVLGEPTELQLSVPRPAAWAALEKLSVEKGAVRGDVRRALFDSYCQRPDPVTAAALFEACLSHEQELVRAAAAAAYFEISAEPALLLDGLAGTAANGEGLAQAVAATSLGRIAPEHPVLDNPWSTPERANDPVPLRTSLLVHGTFARRETWWPPGGDFHNYILDNVRPDLYSEPDCYSWSGGYSAAARALAAQELSEWIAAREGADVDLFAHSHGGNVAMLATHFGVRVKTLVLLSVPVHWDEYFPKAGQVAQAISVRVHCDLVILADRGGQRFRDPAVAEHVLPIWFDHAATHERATWERHGVPSYV